jgi:class 3 adenylate cyclase
MRFLQTTATGIVAIGLYLAVVISRGAAEREQLLLAVFYLVSFLVLGMIASYTLERFTRLLFLRERQVELERSRSDGLLLSILPRPIAERLKERSDEGDLVTGDPALAEEFGDVAVLFADLAGFTGQTTRMRPDELIRTLDGLFSEMDTLARRHGLEKIKTIGDAYMAVAGVPTVVPDPVDRALSMALELVADLEERSWPSGDPVRVRVGISVGPVVAGVIGRAKFAYDVWGDTVNLASRLESGGRPGAILVSAAVADRAADRFRFGPIEHLDLKGRGVEAVRACLGSAEGERPPPGGVER